MINKLPLRINLVFKLVCAILTTSFVVNFSCEIKAQTLSIPLKEDGVHNEDLSLKRELNTNTVANIPSKLFKLWSLRKFTYNPAQSLYDEVIEGKRSLSGFKQFINANEIDTTFLSKKKIPNNLVYVFTGIDFQGKKHVIVDVNANHDFADDRDYIFNLDSVGRIFPKVKVKVGYFDGSAIKDTAVTMMIDAYRTSVPDSYFSVINDKKLDITMLNVLSNWSGKVAVEKQDYWIQINGYNEIYKNSKFNLSVEKVDTEFNTKHSYAYSSTDTIALGYRLYLVSRYHNHILTLKYIGEASVGGGEISTPAPKIEAKDMLTNQDFSLKSQLGNYVLIDFWGSWCNPCIKAIPELKNIYHNYKNRIEFLSIAYDKPENQSKLKELIGNYQMNWHHVFDSMDKGKSIFAKEYKVQEFPTSILIDPKGKVVFRAVGGSGLKNLVEYLTSVGIKPSE